MLKINAHKLLFSTTIPVRIDDINFSNHLGHDKLVTLLHNARVLFLKKYELSEMNCFDTGLIMLNLKVDYLYQSFYGDVLQFDLYLENLEKAKIEFGYKVTNNKVNKTIATATTVMGFFDYHKQKLIRPPAKFIEMINSILE